MNDLSTLADAIREQGQKRTERQQKEEKEWLSALQVIAMNRLPYSDNEIANHLYAALQHTARVIINLEK